MIEFKFTHVYPKGDDFEHLPRWDCPCRPYTAAVMGVGSGIVHRRVIVPVPDTIPEEWNGHQ